jgi:hypothetical protein
MTARASLPRPIVIDTAVMICMALLAGLGGTGFGAAFVPGASRARIEITDDWPTRPGYLPRSRLAGVTGMSRRALNKRGMPNRIQPIRFGARQPVAPVVELMDMEGNSLALARAFVRYMLMAPLLPVALLRTSNGIGSST